MSEKKMMIKHAGLEKGNTIPVGSRGYLRDSFRKQVLIPAFRSVKEELKYKRKLDVIIESISAGETLSLMIGIGMLTLKLRSLRKELSTLQSKEGP